MPAETAVVRGKLQVREPVMARVYAGEQLGQGVALSCGHVRDSGIEVRLVLGAGSFGLEQCRRQAVARSPE